MRLKLPRRRSIEILVISIIGAPSVIWFGLKVVRPMYPEMPWWEPFRFYLKRSWEMWDTVRSWEEEERHG
jgi:hypothetical protein